MTEPGTNISLYLQPRFADVSDNPSVLVIRLFVGLDIVWDMLPYPTAKHSCVTRDAFLDCARRQDPGRQVGQSLLLDDLRVENQPVPALRIVPSLAPSRVGVDGFLGIDFFAQFERVEWHPRTGFLRLRYARSDQAFGTRS